MTALTYCCIAVEYFSKQVMWFKMLRDLYTVLVDAKIVTKGELGTCIKFTSSVYDYRMRHLCTLCVPNTMDNPFCPKVQSSSPGRVNSFLSFFFPSIYILPQRIRKTYRTTPMLELLTT